MLTGTTLRKWGMGILAGEVGLGWGTDSFHDNFLPHGDTGEGWRYPAAPLNQQGSSTPLHLAPGRGVKTRAQFETMVKICFLEADFLFSFSFSFFVFSPAPVNALPF